jgi:PPK2 family polyphosphate:nucleotide phosphotransferase
MDIGKLHARTDGKFRLKHHDPAATLGLSKSRAERAMPGHVEKLAKLHDLLYAEHKHALLIVLQGMDAAGKDGTIRHVMSGVNPQGCTVTSFKQPTPKELDHDFLWRIHAAVPEIGTIGIFNRSHYEDVLIARVHKLVPKSVWRDRYSQINDFEALLNASGVRILKFFLHMSSAEQEQRFQRRLEDPTRNWKASPADFKERKFWDDYQAAYEDAVARCSKPHAPWYVIPSDNKWFRNFAVSEMIIETLAGLKMRYPHKLPDLKPDAESGH